VRESERQALSRPVPTMATCLAAVKSPIFYLHIDIDIRGELSQSRAHTHTPFIHAIRGKPNASLGQACVTLCGGRRYFSVKPLR
jgi:hypothetical protein